MKFDFVEIGKRITEERKKIFVSDDGQISYGKAPGFRPCKQIDLCRILADHGEPISRPYLSQIETGKVKGTTFSLKLLSVLCEIFNCELGYLLCEPDYKYKSRGFSCVVENTGLSENAVTQLKILSDIVNTREDVPNVFETINFLFENSGYVLLLHDLLTSEPSGFDNYFLHSNALYLFDRMYADIHGMVKKHDADDVLSEFLFLAELEQERNIERLSGLKDHIDNFFIEKLT